VTTVPVFHISYAVFVDGMISYWHFASFLGGAVGTPEGLVIA
jgi:hypothetical protein